MVCECASFLVTELIAYCSVRSVSVRGSRLYERIFKSFGEKKGNQHSSSATDLRDHPQAKLRT